MSNGKGETSVSDSAETELAVAAAAPNPEGAKAEAAPAAEDTAGGSGEVKKEDRLMQLAAAAKGAQRDFDAATDALRACQLELIEKRAAQARALNTLYAAKRALEQAVLEK